MEIIVNISKIYLWLAGIEFFSVHYYRHYGFGADSLTLTGCLGICPERDTRRLCHCLVPALGPDVIMIKGCYINR